MTENNNDLLQTIRDKGEAILSNIDAKDVVNEKQTLKGDDGKTITIVKSGNAARSYYSVSKVLLDVLALELKQGKASEREIADALGKHLQSRVLDKKELDELLRLAQKKQREISQWQTVNPSDLKELIDILGKIMQIIIAALATYQAVKKAKQVVKKRNASRTKKPSR